MYMLRTLFFSSVVALSATRLSAQTKLNDLEMAHVAVTADALDIEYANLVLRHTKNPAVRTFAETMIRDHTAVTAQVVALAKRLNVQAQDNSMSRQLVANSAPIKAQLRTLRGAALDTFYASNELTYHKAVNTLVGNQFIPAIQNAEVKTAFEGALVIFRAHEQHAEMMVTALKK